MFALQHRRTCARVLVFALGLLAFTLLAPTFAYDQPTAGAAPPVPTSPSTSQVQQATSGGSVPTAIIAGVALIVGGLIGAGATVASAWLSNNAANRTARLTSDATKDTADAMRRAAMEAAAAQRDTVVAQIGAAADAEGLRRIQAHLDRRYVRYEATITDLRDAIEVLSEKLYALATASRSRPQLMNEAERARQVVISLMQWLPRDQTPTAVKRGPRTGAMVSAREEAWSFVNHLVDVNAPALVEACETHDNVDYELGRFYGGVRSALDRLAVLLETLDREQGQMLGK